jgi:hypothetical protein
MLDSLLMLAMLYEKRSLVYIGTKESIINADLIDLILNHV